MASRLLAAAAAGVLTLALAASANALQTVTNGAYTLDDTQFGVQTGVHSDERAGCTVPPPERARESGKLTVTFFSNDMIQWNPGGGEATLSGAPSFDDLLVTLPARLGQGDVQSYVIRPAPARTSTCL
jgi:hypothetical protein